MTILPSRRICGRRTCDASDKILVAFRCRSGRRPSDADLKKLECLFAKAAKAANTAAQTQKSPATESGVQYAMAFDKNGKKYWRIESEKDIFKGLTGREEYRKAAFDYILANRDSKTVIHAIDGKNMEFIRLSAEEFTNSEESKTMYSDTPLLFMMKMRMIPSLEDLAMNASVNWRSPDHKKHKMFKEKGFENFRGRVGIDNVIFNYIVRAGKASFGDVFYDINLEVDQILPHVKKHASEINRSTSDKRLPQSDPVVNTQSMQEQTDFAVGENETIQYSLPDDTAYMDAVNRGDMETAQRMVDEAASAAMPDAVLRDAGGKLIKMYHGSPNTFNEFRNNEGRGHYFSPWESFAQGYGDTRAFYLNLTNPALFDYDWNNTNGVAEADADGFIYLPEDMEGGINPDQIGDTEVGVYDSDQIKSADPVTYDDDGKVIPLSQRFDTSKTDIRYSLPTGELSTEVKPPKNKPNRKMSKSI